MKISCIAINYNLIKCDEQTKIINYINSKFYEIGEKISLISYFENSYENIKNIFEDNSDMVFIIGTNDCTYNYNIKNNISRVIGEKMEANHICRSSLTKYCNDNNIVFSMQEENEVQIPINSIPLVSDKIQNNGFMYKYNNTYIVFLPSNFEFAKFNYDSYICPLVNDLLNIKKECQVIKCYGLLEKDIRNMLSDFYNFPFINIIIMNDDIDNTIYIRYDIDDSDKIQNIVAEIVEKLNKFIYALEDISIYQMAIDLLRIQKKNIAICETMTYGNIAKELSVIDDNCLFCNETYHNYYNMCKNIHINDKVINQYGKYSVNTVYELANGVLEKSFSDLVLFVLGNKKECDTCYIAVGDVDGIHVYKNKINSYNESTIETISKTAVFYLIKKLKQNSLQFS